MMLIFALMSGCSLGRVDHAGCTTDTQCRDLFGYGHYCDEDNFCAQADALDRCEVFPPELSLPLDATTHVLYASLFNHTSETHRARVKSVQLAATQANENGGLDGREFAILQCTIEEDPALDDLDQEGAAQSVSIALATQVGVPAIVGPAASSDTEAAFNAIRDTEATVMISPSATSPALTDLDGITATDSDPGLLWRTAPPDSLQGQVIANDMKDRGKTSAAVVHVSGAYGDGLAQVFAQHFDGDITLLPYSNDSGRDQATADAGDAGVDVVLFISSEVDDIVAFLNAAQALSTYDTLDIFLTDAAATQSVLTGARQASDLFDQVRGTKPAIPSGNLYDTFVASYASSHGGEDASAFSFTAHSYDASWLVIYGTAWADAEGEITGPAIARGLRQLSAGPRTEIRATSWNGVKARFAEGSGIDVVGTSGELDYDSKTEETTAPIEVWTISSNNKDLVTEYVTEVSK